jgi:diketogulonate reductase-like aldo/keto reductase
MPSKKRQIQPAMPPMSRSSTKIPQMIYGTAWKEERSQDLVIKALKAGFRAIDTAPQRKHYRQDLVGQGIREAIGSGIAKREDLYVRDSKLFSYLPSISIADYL